MRFDQTDDPRALDLRRSLGRLDGLPLRPSSARLVLDAPEGEETDRRADTPPPAAKSYAEFDIDPGWVLARSRGELPSALPVAASGRDLLELVARRPWWPAASAASNEALQRLWRHSVAVSLAAGRLAREAGDPEPGRAADAGLLHALGLWALTAIDPQLLATWMAEPDLRSRGELERAWLGAGAASLGRSLAERWGCDPTVVDACWLHDDAGGGLAGCASDPARLAFVQQAYATAERTPWALRRPEPRDPGTMEPGLRVLVAEVQVRCGAGFLPADATPREERLARSNARLRLEVARLEGGRASADRLLTALAESDVAEGADAWAERVGRAFCGEPGIATARVVWEGEHARGDLGADDRLGLSDRPASTERTPWRVVSLSARGGPRAEVHLWRALDGPEPPLDLASPPALGALRAWTARVADQARMQARLDAALRAYRDRVEHEERRLAKAKLDALAEFAAGAGHEMNNPLAVIVGRAQLLMARETDPQASKSLRAILGQAKRAHRILRDLMYIARPPEPRPRACVPEEIVQNCLRDLRPEAEARGVRLLGEPREAGAGARARAWTDPDALRHLVETLLRNAFEATPKGGTIAVTVAADAEGIRGSVHDTGRGIGALEGPHLFDPFYCGRQAGRGLGLGLPRAARMIALSRGELRWHSTPGQGSLFQFTLPQAPPPAPEWETSSLEGPRQEPT